MCKGPIIAPPGKPIKPENSFNLIESFKRFWESITYHPIIYNDAKSEKNEIKESGKNNCDNTSLYDSSAQVPTSTMSF